LKNDRHHERNGRFSLSGGRHHERNDPSPERNAPPPLLKVPLLRDEGSFPPSQRRLREMGHLVFLVFDGRPRCLGRVRVICRRRRTPRKRCAPSARP
jgi:hypothetical protein